MVPAARHPTPPLRPGDRLRRRGPSDGRTQGKGRCRRRGGVERPEACYPRRFRLRRDRRASSGYGMSNPDDSTDPDPCTGRSVGRRCEVCPRSRGRVTPVPPLVPSRASSPVKRMLRGTTRVRREHYVALARPRTSAEGESGVTTRHRHPPAPLWTPSRRRLRDDPPPIPLRRLRRDGERYGSSGGGGVVPRGSPHLWSRRRSWDPCPNRDRVLLQCP